MQTYTYSGCWQKSVVGQKGTPTSSPPRQRKCVSQDQHRTHCGSESVLLMHSHLNIPLMTTVQRVVYCYNTFHWYCISQRTETGDPTTTHHHRNAFTFQYSMSEWKSLVCFSLALSLTPITTELPSNIPWASENLWYVSRGTWWLPCIRSRSRLLGTSRRSGQRLSRGCRREAPSTSPGRTSASAPRWASNPRNWLSIAGFETWKQQQSKRKHWEKEKTINILLLGGHVESSLLSDFCHCQI